MDVRTQERIAYLEKTVDELNDVVARQDAEVRRLEKQVTFLLEREALRETEGGVVIGDERPPHY